MIKSGFNSYEDMMSYLQNTNVEMGETVKVPVNLPEANWHYLMEIAHELDITLNQLAARLLQKAIDDWEANEQKITKKAVKRIKRK